MRETKQKIFLIGFMGTGKSEIAKKLGQMTNFSIADTDGLAEEAMGDSISKIFQEKGELYFRNIETQVLNDVANWDKYVISCGGGLPLKEENREIMKSAGKVVLLTASAQTILDRVKNNTDRPLLAGKMNIEYIETLMKQREAAYANAADVVISTDNKSVLVICQEIMKNFEWLKGV
ncbi:MAG: shikimate kinase [Aminipila sp.]